MIHTDKINIGVPMSDWYLFCKSCRFNLPLNAGGKNECALCRRPLFIKYLDTVPDGEYYLFAGGECYPDGGFDDLKTKGTLDHCDKYFHDYYTSELSDSPFAKCWGHIVDMAKNKILVRLFAMKNHLGKIENYCEWP